MFKARLADLVLPLACAAWIGAVLGLARWNVPPGTADSLENHLAPRMPAFQLKDPLHFLTAFPAFFDGNFGLRVWAVGLRSRIWLWFLRRDPVPDPAFSTMAFPGRGDWLFLADNRIPDDLLHRDPLTGDQLATWKRLIAARREWFAARGIRYLFVLAPDKRTIYPEHLPAFFAAPRPGETRRAQLDRAMQDEPAFLDLAGAVASAKPSGQLYFRWDTHWNPAGAYVGYAAAMERLGLSPLPFGLGRPLGQDVNEGDLGRVIGLKLIERTMAPAPACPRPAAGAEKAEMALAARLGAPIYAERRTVCPGAPGRLLMLHDSFGNGWMPYLSSQFGYADYEWTVPSFAQLKAMVEATHPSVVIEERVERFLILPMW